MFGIDDAIVAAGVSAGAQLIGGYLTGKDANKNHKKQTERNRNQTVLMNAQLNQLTREHQNFLDLNRPQWQRQGAEAAGFNPLLFAAPNGIASGASATMGGATWAGNPMGDAVARAGSAIADGFGRAADLDMQRAELELERERVEGLLENMKLRPEVPGIMSTSRTAAKGGVGGGVADAILDVKTPTVTSADHVNASSYVDPRSPDAEMGETRYGDIVQEFAGGLNVLRDFSYNNSLQTVVRGFGKEAADKVNEVYASDPSLTLEQAIKVVTDPLKTSDNLRSGRLTRRGTK